MRWWKWVWKWQEGEGLYEMLAERGGEESRLWRREGFMGYYLVEKGGGVASQ